MVVGLSVWLLGGLLLAARLLGVGCCLSSPKDRRSHMAVGHCTPTHSTSLSPSADAEYDHDAGLEHLDRPRSRGAREKEESREKQRQIRDYQRHSSALVRS